ncbi:hypothetical protein PGT21_025090 [Puccinia graminis f. sp. tritici]|uniref:Uncharacterized protein n=1 Tax=Puccinia graminis f. sp. tritici TaxID=56615 RepID=A0A5B0MPD2_PUCGR|nr:hypothetical protein PGT21_000404 [Puccinia graminis f. sp. tritici]KAA1078711.1 hypothetical protein PGT21_000640 [Puccinia graminis f. sp. tritici]KAA1096644.1 hypothetical protein PGT21_023744 [Puccinia graminis f. sp. tritici]KAA1113206.1 hypothetical protein PGT21_025090 [Puccinia graminis f. sp. tritici]KAA1113631.1 hypothetical protein PGTUg99_010532 [Puccinia graminis f. sp. tritici]
MWGGTQTLARRVRKNLEVDVEISAYRFAKAKEFLNLFSRKAVIIGVRVGFVSKLQYPQNPFI